MKIVKCSIVFVSFSVIVLIAFSTIKNIYLPYTRIEPSHLPPRIKLLSILYENVYKLFSLEDIRKDIKGGEIPYDDELVDIEIGSYASGDVSLQYYTYRTKNTTNENIEIIFLYFHPGGFVWGHPRNLFFTSKELIKRMEIPIMIIAPEYRLTPEFSINDVFEDAYNSYLHISEGYDEKLFVFVGESAGGRLATMTARRVMKRERKDRNFHVMMYYPYLCDGIDDEGVCKDLESRIEFEYGALTSRYFDEYLKEFNGRQNIAHRTSVFSFSPEEMLSSHDIINPSYDYYRDEGRVYHQLLSDHGQAKMKYHYYEVEGELHSFLNPQNLVGPDSSVDEIYQKYFVDLVMKKYESL